MNRRNWIRIALGGVAAGAATEALAQDKTVQPKGEVLPKSTIVLYCDLAVDKAKEQQMLKHFHEKFKPAGAKFKGYIDVKMLKYDHKVQGPDIAKGINYRFQLTYASLAEQQVWVNSDTHKKLWPGIGDCLLDQNFQVLVFNRA
jgi:hypothetical protein